MTTGARPGEALGGYFKSGVYRRDEIPNWVRCGDCGARVLRGQADLHDSDCTIGAMLRRLKGT